MTATPRIDNGNFRGLIGLIAMIGAFAGFFALFFVEVPEGNREPMLLALGFVMGWAGSVVSSEYGATTTGRKVADSAIRNIERQNIANEPGVQEVSVINPPSEPVPTKASK